jgi:hypothetical protein
MIVDLSNFVLPRKNAPKPIDWWPKRKRGL